MIEAAAATVATRSAVAGLAAAYLEAASRPTGHPSHLLHILLHFGFVGLLLISIVDSSFVPLPVPGITDIMLIVLAAANRDSWLMLAVLVLLASLGSAVGGYFSYKVGHAGGMSLLKKHVPARIFKSVTHWMENNAMLSVALPAILPPPVPLSPFVLAAGALNMSRSKFLSTFTISRAVRHSIAVWLGVRYGHAVIRLWNGIFARYATPTLIAFWSILLVSCGYGFWRLYKTSRRLGTGSAMASSTDAVPSARV